ncbi:hypothetical protein JCM3775_000826 [Rhodotorula graminis]|uniref:Uncharacterized protein n=1 Tax=Rhodotorula graminis (strain WP1) TaxID=578459 RepID=A0A0P9EIS9_RHOGW|nr:uncharacterized protein RHOBADRAFT_66790 [Rhodotorula graminis WP1]KPV73345.1 hypothetical protein RHOBADRAFT_66790 [Rhodotorula graminis WP1]
MASSYTPLPTSAHGIPLAPRASTPKARRIFAAVGVALTLVGLFAAHRRYQPDVERAPVQGYPVDSAALACAHQDVAACDLSAIDLAQAPQDLFRLAPVAASVEAGTPLLLEIVATSNASAECLLRSSIFAIGVSGPRIQRAHATNGGGSALSLLSTVTMDEPGEYRIEAYLRLFNYPLAICDASAARGEGRYVDQIVAGGNTTIVVLPTSTGAAPSAPERQCRYGELYDMRGAWLEPPVPASIEGVFEKARDCALEALPTPAEAFAQARAHGIRWLRFLGDSNTRNLYDSFPLVDPASSALRNYRADPPYDLRATCGEAYDPPSRQQRNARPTRKFCRVGLVDGDVQDDLVVSWEWFTPIHDPPLAAYFADGDDGDGVDTKSPLWTDSTLGSVLGAPELDPRNSAATIESVLADRPDLLALRGGDRVFLSYGSHAMMHTRDDVGRYVDEVESAAERLAELESDDPESPQKRLSFALSTTKSCRKFSNATEITPAMLRTCHSDNFRDKNLAILREFAARRLSGPNGESLPAASSSSTTTNRVPLDVLDFWHTTEAIEDYMTDKVHFGPGVYFVHSRAVATSWFADEV